MNTLTPIQILDSLTTYLACTLKSGSLNLDRSQIDGRGIGAKALVNFDAHIKMDLR